MNTKYTSTYSNVQDRTGTGKFSTIRRMATQRELNDKAQAAQRERSETDKALAAKFGTDADELFA